MMQKTLTVFITVFIMNELSCSIVDCICAVILVRFVRRGFNHEIEVGDFQSFAAAGNRMFKYRLTFHC